MPKTLENDVLGAKDYTETLQEKYVLWKSLNWISADSAPPPPLLDMVY